VVANKRSPFLLSLACPLMVGIAAHKLAWQQNLYKVWPCPDGNLLGPVCLVVKGNTQRLLDNHLLKRGFQGYLLHKGLTICPLSEGALTGGPQVMRKREKEILRERSTWCVLEEEFLCDSTGK
jgi:hypothetical protein